MRNHKTNMLSFKYLYNIVFVTILFFISYNKLQAQEPPPVPIQVNVVRNISFGTFVQTGGAGSATVTYDGFRSGSNVFFLTGYSYTSGQFTISGNKGTNVSVSVDTNPVTLSNGTGGTMSLNINQWSLMPPQFIIPSDPPTTFPVEFGGTLTVPAASPSGSYTGTIYFTFIQNYE
jgi:hypothetical protein